MTRTSIVSMAIATVLAAGPASAQTRPNAKDQEEMHTAQFFVGKWNCAHAVGEFSGTYTTTYTSALGGTWIEQQYDFPAAGGDAPVHAEYFLGYDVRHGRHARGQRLVVELRPAGTGSPGGMDQDVGHRIHGGWAELPCQWQDGHGASHLSQGVMIKSRDRRACPASPVTLFTIASCHDGLLVHLPTRARDAR